MVSGNNAREYAYLEHLKTEDLEELLRDDLLSSDSSDPELFLYAMEVIARREKETTEQDKAHTERAWREFQEIYNTPEGIGRTLYPAENPPAEQPAANLKGRKPLPPRHHHRHFYRILSVAAAAAVILIFMVPTALGYESFYHMIGRWTEEAFQFQRGEDTPVGQDKTDESDSSQKEYTNLQDALIDYGIPIEGIPSAVPEGFELQAVDVSEHSALGKKNIFAYYLKESSVLVISVTQYSSPQSFAYEKNNTHVEKYEQNEMTYYIFTNIGQATAVWYTDYLEYSIYGDISTDELKSMITTNERD